MRRLLSTVLILLTFGAVGLTQSLTVSPSSVTLSPGATQQFTASQSGVRWTAEGGTITDAGFYTAGSTPGTYVVTARIKNQRGTATVVIQGPPPPPTEICTNGIDDDGDGLIDGADPDCPPSQTSPDCTAVPPASQIVDAARDVWTISAPDLILRNGSHADAGYGRGSEILWAASMIYVLGGDSNWYQWSGAGWWNIGPTRPACGPPPPPPPPDGIQLFPGANIQAQVDANPTYTRFVLNAGTYARQQVKPKDGNQFLCQPGAILDGQGVTTYAFETYSHSPRDVVISGCVIMRYNPPSQQAAIQGDNAINWVIQDNEIKENTTIGVKPGKGARVLRNYVHHNGKLGIGGFRADGTLFEGNEVSYNNTSQTPEDPSLAEASGIKCFGGSNLTFRSNVVHHNWGPGIWTDNVGINTLIENNRVEDNSHTGIWHEVSYNAIIRNNTVLRNGLSATPGWLERGGINVTNAPNVEVSNNVVEDNANGIGVMQASGYPSDTGFGPLIVQNLRVLNNTVRMIQGRTGMATNSDPSIYTSRNNVFDFNRYTLGANAIYFLWNEQNLNEFGWRNYGNDVNGTFTRSGAAADALTARTLMQEWLGYGQDVNGTLTRVP